MNRRITSIHIAHVKSLERQGRITPDSILADAKREESPLHNLYDWDVTKAAEAHWIDRTREIIGMIHVLYHTETRTYQLPNYVRDPSAHPKEQGYISVDVLQADTVLAFRAIRSELERVTAALERAETVAVGLGFEDQITDLLARIAGLQRVIAAETSSKGNGDGIAVSV